MIAREDVKAALAGCEHDLDRAAYRLAVELTGQAQPDGYQQYLRGVIVEAITAAVLDGDAELRTREGWEQATAESEAWEAAERAATHRPVHGGRPS